MVKGTVDSRSWKAVVSGEKSHKLDVQTKSYIDLDAMDADDHVFTTFKTIFRGPGSCEDRKSDTTKGSILSLPDPFESFANTIYNGSSMMPCSTALPSFDLGSCVSTDMMDGLGKLGYGQSMMCFDKLAQALTAESASYADKEKFGMLSETPLTHLASMDNGTMGDVVTPLGLGSVDIGSDFADRLGKLLQRCMSDDDVARNELVALCAHEFHLTDSVLSPAVVSVLLRYCLLKGQLYLAGQLLQIAWDMDIQIPAGDQSQVLLTLCSDDAIGLVRNLLSKLPFPSPHGEDIMSLFVKGIIASATDPKRSHLSKFVSILEDASSGSIDYSRAYHLIQLFLHEIYEDNSKIPNSDNIVLKLCKLDAFSRVTPECRFKTCTVLCRMPAREKVDDNLRALLSGDNVYACFMEYVGQHSPSDFVTVINRLINSRCLSALSFLRALYLGHRICMSGTTVLKICLAAQRSLKSIVPEKVRCPGFGDFEFLTCVGVNAFVKLLGPTLPISLLCVCASVSCSGKEMFAPLVEACLLVQDHSAAESVIKYMNEYYGHVPAALLTTTLQSYLLHGNFRRVLECMSKNDRHGDAFKECKNRGLHANVAAFGLRVALSVLKFDIAAEFLNHCDNNEKISAELSTLLQQIPPMLDSRNKVDEFVTLCEHLNLDESAFAVVLDCCIRLKNSKRLLRLINRFRKMGLQPQAQTCGVIIKSLGCCGRIAECKEIWHDLTVKRGNEPNEVVYGIMLDALVSNNKMDEALSLLDDMKNKGNVKPNTIMYTTLIKGFGQNRQLSKAMSIYEEMVAREIPRNTVTYNSIIDACARVGDMKTAASLLEEMMINQVEPDLITFSTIIKGYCVQCNMDQSFQLLSIMYERGIKPDGILYNSLLEGCVKSGRLWLCEKLWEQMRLHGIAPSNFTLTILIKMYGRSGQLDKVFELVGRLPMEYGFTINAHVYTCLMSACITNSRYSTALDIYKCMKDGGIKADAKTYETLLLGATRGNLFVEAADVLKDMYNLSNDNSGATQSSREIAPYQKINPRILENLFNKVQQSRSDAGIMATYRALSKKLQSLGVNVPSLS